MSEGNAAFSRLEFAVWKSLLAKVGSGGSTTFYTVPTGKVFVGLGLNVTFDGSTTTNLVILSIQRSIARYNVWLAVPGGSSTENIAGLTGPLVAEAEDDLVLTSTNGGFEIALSGYLLPQNFNAG